MFAFLWESEITFFLCVAVENHVSRSQSGWHGMAWNHVGRPINIIIITGWFVCYDLWEPPLNTYSPLGSKLHNVAETLGATCLLRFPPQLIWTDSLDPRSLEGIVSLAL